MMNLTLKNNEQETTNEKHVFVCFVVDPYVWSLDCFHGPASICRYLG